MKLGFERIKTIAELTQRLTVIIGQIVSRLTSLEAAEVVEPIIPEVESKHYISYYKNNVLVDAVTNAISGIRLDVRNSNGIAATATLGKAEITKNGVYNFTGQARLVDAGWSTGSFEVFLVVNGVTTRAGNIMDGMDTTGVTITPSTNITTFAVPLEEGDQVEMRAKQLQTASLNIFTGSGKEFSTRWELVEI